MTPSWFVYAVLIVFLLFGIDRFVGAAEGDENAVPVKFDMNGTASDINGATIAPPNSDYNKLKDQGGESKQAIGKDSEFNDTKGSSSEENGKIMGELNSNDSSHKIIDKLQSHSVLSGNQSVDEKPKDSPPDKRDRTSVETEQEENSEKKSADEGSTVKKLPGGCEPSNSCTDEMSKFIACLRVPGEDSLDLSLLIQNKGKGPITVNIEAPDFVILEKNMVQLEGEKDGEVKVSFKEGSSDTVIVLKAGEGQCKLVVRNMIPDSTQKSEKSQFYGYTGLYPKTPHVYILIGASVVMGVVLLFVRFWRMRRQVSSPRFEKVDVGLPISSGGKKEINDVGGWDDSWGDDWDDEEAPATPSVPVLTPSSRGLASRRSNKDGWKN